MLKGICLWKLPETSLKCGEKTKILNSQVFVIDTIHRRLLRKSDWLTILNTYTLEQSKVETGADPAEEFRPLGTTMFLLIFVELDLTNKDKLAFFTTNKPVGIFVMCTIPPLALIVFPRLQESVVFSRLQSAVFLRLESVVFPRLQSVVFLRLEFVVFPRLKSVVIPHLDSVAKLFDEFCLVNYAIGAPFDWLCYYFRCFCAKLIRVTVFYSSPYIGLHSNQFVITLVNLIIGRG